jgi:putative colanic acid biosynthesis acetyltransferase WcaF
MQTPTKSIPADSSLPSQRLRTLPQSSAFASPWPTRTRISFVLWNIIWLFFFRPTPKPMMTWRLFLLRLFGAKISGHPFIAASARIKMPWNLIIEDRACIGERVEVYNLGPIILRERCTIAQETYLCAGTHDFTTPDYLMVVGPIEVRSDVFIGARAFLLPGIIIGEGAIIGACSVVSRDMPPWMICAGNPCKPIKPREFRREGDENVVSLAKASRR